MGSGGRGGVGRAGMFAGRFSVSDRQRVDERRLKPPPELRPVSHGWSDGLVTAKACGSGTRGWCQIGGGFRETQPPLDHIRIIKNMTGVSLQ